MPSRKKKPAGEAAEAVEAPAAASPKAVPKAEAKAEADPQPKAKAEAKAKADAKAAPKAKAEAAPKAEAKAKADAKAKAAPKADAKASPKSQPKAETKGKAKAEAKSQPAAAKAEAKAEPKSKGKAKAKAQEAPPPPPPPVEEEDDLTVVKSRRGKKKKAEEIPADQELVPEEVPTVGPPSAEELADQKRIRKEHDKKNNALSEKFQQDLSKLPAISTNKSREQVIREVSDQKKALENIMNEINDTLKTVKIAKPKNTNVGAIMQQMRDLKLAKSGSLFTETTIKYMTEDFSMCLTQALAFDSYRAFQAEAAVIREKCQVRIDSNEACLKTVKSKADQNKVLKMIADAKGVKIEDLNEKDIVSQNVDLPVEVTGLQFLYKRQFEKQYGVVIDRPEGAKGGGKGSSSPPPKGFIIRGLKKEVAECIAALKGLNLKEQKIVTGVTPKQASAIMGSQQANARKLEEEFKGVFVHREGGQGAPITLYGPVKEVTACHKSIMDNLSDEPEAPVRPVRPPKPEQVTMTIDKDLAKCLIGAGGVTVTKMETETSTSIKVSNHQGKDDETQATVRITGDKANQDKAKAKITDFLYTLSSCLVEAEPEAVSRLYDGAVPRKGKGDKGKGKGKGSSKGDGEKGGNGASDSKFAELWNTSGLTCLKKAKGVQIVGTKADVAKWKVVLEECLKEAGTIPFAVRLTFEQGRLWSQERLDGVKASSEAQKVQKATRGRDTYIEAHGTDEQKEKAQAAVEEINQKLSNKDQIDDVDESTKRYLTGRGIAQLREVETKHDVCVSVDRKEKGQSVRIVGAAEGVVAAKKQLEEIISSSASITLEINIEWDEGRVIIGKNGSTVNWIKRESGVEQVKVEEADEKKKVVLRGQKEAIEAAEKLVKEVLQKEKEAAAERAAKGTNGGAEDAAEEKPKKKEAAKKDDASEATEKRPSEKKWAGKAAVKQPEFKTTEASFPSLGGDDPKGKAKPRAGGVWNKGEKEGATEAVVEEKVEEKGEEKEEEKDDGN